MSLKATTIFLSIGLHALIALAFVKFEDGASLDAGSGDDLMTIEQGVAIEGLSTIGQDEETIEAIEAEEVQASEARAEIKEVEAEEQTTEPPPEEIETAQLPDETEILSARDAPEAEAAPVKPEEPKQEEAPQPAQTAAVAQEEQLSAEEKRASGAAQTGGDATQKRLYFGKLAKHLERKKVNPRTRRKGTVVVRFTIDPTGAVTSSEVVTSSGHKALDDAAIASLKRASPFPSFSQSVSSEPLVLSVPFRFTVR